jgi:hypothetical protein
MNIPKEVLTVAFREDTSNWRKAPVSMDSLIINKVIRERVMVDADLVGGSTVIIPLSGLSPTYTDVNGLVYEIPMELTNFRTIMSVLSVSYVPYTMSFAGSPSNRAVGFNNNISDLEIASQRVGDAMSGIPPISSASARLIGHNTILLNDTLRVTNAYQVRCILGNEENLNNISPRSYLYFADLCIHAAKAYIYNKLIVMMDQAYLSGGQELGAIKSIVEGYSDSYQNYDTYLREVWQRVAVFNDQPQHQRLIRTMISPGL